MQKKGMELEGLVKSGDVVLAGVSGGADSVCLLLMLLEYRKHCDFFLEAVHVEHGIRGDASRRDAAFVKRLCEKRGVCCRIYPVDVPAYAKGHGLGVEEAARKLRYECFREAAEDYDGRPVKIALRTHAVGQADHTADLSCIQCAQFFHMHASDVTAAARHFLQRPKQHFPD